MTASRVFDCWCLTHSPQNNEITFEIQLTSFGAVQNQGATGPDVQLKCWFQFPQNFWQTPFLNFGPCKNLPGSNGLRRWAQPRRQKIKKTDFAARRTVPGFQSDDAAHTAHFANLAARKQGSSTTSLVGATSLNTMCCNVNPGLINHGLLIGGYSSNNHYLILRW